MFILLPVCNNAATFVPLIRTSMYIKSPTFSSTESHTLTSFTLFTHLPALLVFTPQTFGADLEPGATSFSNFSFSYTHQHCVLSGDKFGRWYWVLIFRIRSTNTPISCGPGRDIENTQFHSLHLPLV